jgi:hypothetical protein
MHRRLVVVAATAALVGCGGSSDHGPASAQLALMPLPKEAFGPAASKLTIDSSSGTATNVEASHADLDPAVTPAYLKRLGRLEGYSLDFSSVRAFTAGSGLVDAVSGVDLFASPAGAAKYVAKQLSEPGELERRRGVTGISYHGVSSFRIPLESGSATAVSGEIRLGGLSFWMTFSIFRRGSLVAEVALTHAHGLADDRVRIPGLTRALERRVGDGLAGRLRGRPVVLPSATRLALGGLGRPKGAPELADAVVGAADLAPATVVGEGYARDPDAVAAYLRRLAPARLGKSGLVRVDASVQLHRTAKDGFAAFATRRAAVTGARGRAFLVRTFAGVLGTAGAPSAVFAGPRTIKAGDAAFALSATVRRKGGMPSRLVIGVVNVGRLDQTVTLIGRPGASLAGAEVASLLRRAAGRMRDSLAAVKGIVPA